MAAQSQIDPAKLPYLAELLSIHTEGRYSPINVQPSELKERTIETLISLLVDLASRAPVLFLLEQRLSKARLSDSRFSRQEDHLSLALARETPVLD
jgi:hypothetical protein